MNSHNAQMLAAYNYYVKGEHKTREIGRSSMSVSCPFHHDEHPSCYLYGDHWHCFSCNEGGSAENFVRRTRYADLSDQEGYIKAYADLGLSALTDQPRRRKSVIEQWRDEAYPLRDEHPLSQKQMEIIHLVSEIYVRSLAERSNVTAVQYATQRGLLGFSDEPLWGTGYCSGVQLLNYLDGKDFELWQAAKEVGLIGYRDNGMGPAYERMRGRLTIPNPTGTTTADWMTCRAVPGLLPTSARCPKYMHLTVPKPLFGAVYCEDRNKPTVIVEGPLCVLSLISLGINAVALCGKSLAERHRSWFLGRDVFLCLDNPECEKSPGDMLAAVDKLAQQLKGYVRSINYIDLPTGIKDPGEYVQMHGDFPLIG